MVVIAALIHVSDNLGYLLPALIGLESMGVPSPGETALVAAAVLASQGKLNIELVIVIAAASAIIGDNIGYLIGRKLGREVLTATGPFHEHRKKLMDVGDSYFDRYGSKTVFIGRWIALIRFAVSWLAGINKMPFRTFFLWNAAGGITWAIAFGLGGYWGGTAFAKVLEKVGIGAAVVLVIGLLAFFFFKRRAENRLEASVESDLGSSGGTHDSKAAPASSPTAAPAPTSSLRPEEEPEV